MKQNIVNFLTPKYNTMARNFFDETNDAMAKSVVGINRLVELSADKNEQAQLQAKAAKINAALESRANSLANAENARNSRIRGYVKVGADSYLKEARTDAGKFWNGNNGEDKETDVARITRLCNHFAKFYVDTLPKAKTASLLDTI